MYKAEIECIVCKQMFRNSSSHSKHIFSRRRINKKNGTSDGHDEGLIHNVQETSVNTSNRGAPGGDVDKEERKKKLPDDDLHKISAANELLALLKQNGDFEELNENREKFSAWLPLTVENWLSWIGDQRQQNAPREEIEKLFKRAIKDHNKAQIWFEFLFHGLTQEFCYALVSFETAIVNFGLRADGGGKIWLLYIRFLRLQFTDVSRTAGLFECILTLFKRALHVPLPELSEILEEAKTFFVAEQNRPDCYLEVVSVYNGTINEAKRLEELDTDNIEITRKMENLLQYELHKGNMVRVQMMYERAVTEVPDVDKFWIEYGAWCEQKLKIHSVTCEVYDRAVRFVRNSAALNQQTLSAMERAERPFEKIDAFFVQARDQISDLEDGKRLYRTYICLLRRRAAKTDGNYSKMAEIFEEGARNLSEWFGVGWDFSGGYRENLARFYATNGRSIEKAREVWKDILASGSGNQAAKWIEAARFEREYGTVANVRQILAMSLNSVSDEIEKMYDYCYQFEQDEGTLEERDAVLEKINHQIQLRFNRPRKRGPEVAEVTKRVPKQKGDGTMAKKSKRNEKHEKKPILEKTVAPKPSASTAAGDGESSRTVFVSNLDFGTTEDDINKVIEGVEQVRFAPRVGKSDLHRGFGYVVLTDDNAAQNALKKDRTLVNGRPMFISENDPEKRVGFKYATGLEKSKIFVRNVHFKANEEEIKEVFAKFGNVSSVRLVRHKNGQPKGVAFVDFETEEGALETLKAEKIMLKGRDLAVALSNPPDNEQKKPAENVYDMAALNAPRRGQEDDKF